MKSSAQNPLLRKTLLAATISLCLGHTAQAALIYWDGAASASWGTASSWSTDANAATPNPAAEPGAIDDVIFNGTSNNAINQIVTLNGAKNALSLTFNNSGTNLVRSDSSTTRVLTLGIGGMSISSGAGAVTIGAPTNGTQVLLGGSQSWVNNSGTTATIYNSIGRSNGSVLTLAPGTGTFTATIHSPSNGLIGTWAAIGSETSLRYVAKTTSAPTNVLIPFSSGTAAADASALVDTTGAANYDLASAAGTAPDTVSLNTIRFTGPEGTLAPGATSFTARGLMNAGTGKWTIGPNPITIGSTNELVIIANSQDTEISSAIQNNGITASSVSYHGGGTLTLSGNNTFTNGLNIGSGKVLVNNAGALNSSTPNSINFNGSSGTLSLNGNSNLSVAGINSFGAGTIPQPNQIVENASASAVTLNVGGVSSDSTFYGSIQNGTGAGTLGLTKIGTGTFTLAGTNTYTGITTANAGVLAATLPTTLPGFNSPGRVVFNGGTISLRTGDGTTSGWSMAQLDSFVTSSTKTSGSLGIDTTTGNITRSTDFNIGALGLTKLGTNALTLTSAQTHTGITNVANGVLTVQNAGSLGTTSAGTTVSTAGRLELDGGITISGEPLTIAGSGGTGFFNGALNSRTGVNVWTGNITINSNDSRIGAQAGASIEVSGVIDSGVNPHLVTFRPADTTATVIISGANTYVGPTTLTGGLVTANSLNSVTGGTSSSSFGAPTTVANGTITFGASEGSGLRYVGTGETTDRVINLGGGTQGGRIEQAGSGLLRFTSAFTATGTGSKTLTLQGSTSGIGQISGAVVNNTNGTTLLGTAYASGASTITLTSVEGISAGASISGTGIPAAATVTAVNTATRVVTLSAATTAANTVNSVITVTGVTNPTSITKAGTGTWILSGANSYTGGTTVTGGTLRLDYSTSDSSKLSDNAALTLGASTIELSGGTHNETVASTTLTAGTASKITRNSGSAVLQLNTITRNTGASIDFGGSGIATTDNTNTNGILGAWATINGNDWAANSTNGPDGLITAANYTNIDAQPGGSGSTVINTGAADNVRIFGNGSSPGNITLGSSSVSINTLLQANTTQSAIVDPGTAETLRAGGIMIGASAKSLTVGTVANDGVLTAATAGGDLLLRNNSATELLTINSIIANNTSASTLTKDGTGTLVLAGSNSFTGATNLVEGTLRAGSSSAFGGASALVMSGSSTLDLGGFNGTFTNLTSTAANTITTTGAGSGIDTLTVSALTAGSPALFTDNGTRRLALAVAGTSGSPLTNTANTFSGGLAIGSTVRITVTPGTVGNPGAIVNGPFGRGAITVNGGNTFDAGAQIWFSTSNRTLVNDVIVNGNGGMGSRAGTFRIGTNGNALSNIGISGNVTANLSDAHFGSDSTQDGTILLLSGRLTGNSGFRFFQSANAFRWTALLNNATGSPNDYSGPTTINSAQTTLALGAAEQIPNGIGRGNVVLTSGALDLAGFNETINGLSGAGATAIVDNVSTGTSNTLTLGDGDATGTTFAGVIRNSTGSLALTKIGSGTQTLNGVNTYTGATTINAGTLALGIVGTIANSSSITIAPGATLQTTAKTSYAIPAGQTLTFGVNGAGSGSSGVISATELDISAASVTFNITGPLDDPSYVIANYTTRVGTAFASVSTVPGYVIDYAFNGGTQIALVQSATPPSPYETWIDSFPSLTGPSKLPTADPDGDGLTNQQEFAFGLNPTSGSSVNPYIAQLDRTSGQFTYQRRAASGLNYTIWTSTDLVSWTQDSAATQTPTPSGNNESVVVTLSANKPLTASRLFIRVKAD